VGCSRKLVEKKLSFVVRSSAVPEHAELKGKFMGTDRHVPIKGKKRLNCLLGGGEREKKKKRTDTQIGGGGGSRFLRENSFIDP